MPTGSEVERERIEKSGYRTFVVTVRPTCPAVSRRSATSCERRFSSS